MADVGIVLEPQNFEMYAGDTKDLVIPIEDDQGNATVLVDAHVVWQMGKSDWKTTGTPLLVKDSDVVGDVTFMSGGVPVVHLVSTDTEGLPPASYYHEAQVTLADGTVGTVLVGKIKIKQNLVEPR